MSDERTKIIESEKIKTIFAINIEFFSPFETKNAISVQNNYFFIKIILTNDFEFVKNVFVVVITITFP